MGSLKNDQKDFNRLVEGIRNYILKNKKNESIVDLVNIIADICQENNLRFNRQKFLEACGIE